MPGAAAPSPLTSSVGVGAGAGWGQTTEKVSSFCWKGWELQWGVEGKEENGSLPDQESHLRGLPPNALSCLWWGQRPQHGHLPHPEKDRRELTHAENGPSGH